MKQRTFIRPTMTRQRMIELTKNLNATLTKEELAEGWHFCSEFDGLLIHSSHPEYEVCTCELD